MGEHDGQGRNGTGALDRLAARMEDALDRAAAAVERKMEGLERRLADAYEGEPPRDAPEATAQVHEEPSPMADARKDSPGPGKEPGWASRIAGGYAKVVEKARSGVSGAVARGAGVLDDAAGEAPWKLAGLDGRRTRIAREVMREVVPKVAGDRVASVLDGAAMKGGVAGLGLLLRIPLKGFAVPFLLGITAVETVRAVREVKDSVADVAARVDNEARSEEAYRTGATQA